MTDKYKNLAPKDKYRYKKRTATCCFSRVGMPKKSFDSEAEAMSHAIDGEAYKCRVHPDKWHVRTKR